MRKIWITFISSLALTLGTLSFGAISSVGTVSLGGPLPFMNPSGSSAMTYRGMAGMDFTSDGSFLQSSGYQGATYYPGPSLTNPGIGREISHNDFVQNNSTNFGSGAVYGDKNTPAFYIGAAQQNVSGTDIFKYSPSGSGQLTQVITLNSPYQGASAMTMGASSNYLYVITYNNYILKIDLQNNTIASAAGPFDVKVDVGTIPIVVGDYMYFTSNSRFVGLQTSKIGVWKFQISSGALSQIYSNGPYTNPASSQMSGSLAIDRSNNFLFAADGNKMLRFDISNQAVSPPAPITQTLGSLISSFALSDNGQHLWVSSKSATNTNIYKIFSDLSSPTPIDETSNSGFGIDTTNGFMRVNPTDNSQYAVAGYSYPNPGSYFFTNATSPIPSVVQFDPNGGTGSVSSQISSSATTLNSNTFTKNGYTFSGWNTAANGSGNAFQDQDVFPFSGNTTLYAQWTATSPIPSPSPTSSSTPAGPSGSSSTAGLATTGAQYGFPLGLAIVSSFLGFTLLVVRWKLKKILTNNLN